MRDDLVVAVGSGYALHALVAIVIGKNGYDGCIILRESYHQGNNLTIHGELGDGTWEKGA